MAQANSTFEERAENLRNLPSTRAGKTTLNLTHRRPHLSSEEEIVKREIMRVLGNDRRLGLVGDEGAEFLLSMGLTVKDASQRAQLLAESLPFAVRWKR